jgi:hypothetical protein
MRSWAYAAGWLPMGVGNDCIMYLEVSACASCGWVQQQPSNGWQRCDLFDTILVGYEQHFKQCKPIT